MKGQGMALLFGAAFALFVGGVYMFIRSDDTAYSRANDRLAEINGEIQKGIKELQSSVAAGVVAQDELKGLIEKTFLELDAKISSSKDRMDAMDLELTRVKDRINKINVRATPTTHTVRLEIIEPPKIEQKKPLIPPDLLNRAGVIKKKKAKPMGQ